MLEFRNITKSFNSTGNIEDLRVALDHVNLKIEDGEFVTIIGSNGSGKSTSMNIITGSIFPDDGEVVLSGMDITKMKEYQRAKYFGRVFQDPMMGTTAEMSCLENLEIAFRRGKHHSPFKWGFSSNMIKEHFMNLLEEFDLGLENRLSQKVGVMSGGQRQALTLLMAATDARLDTRKEFVKMYFDIHTGQLRQEQGKLRKSKDPKIQKIYLENKELVRKYKINSEEVAGKFYDQQFEEYQNKLEQIKKIDDAEIRQTKSLEYYLELSNNLHEFNQDRKILLLDEHTAALDPKTAKKVLDLTDKIVRSNNLTTLMVTHNMRDAITYGDRLIMFHHGHIIHDIKGKEKQKLTVDKLLSMFDEADKQLEE